jgi:hypothetical protein
MDKWQHKASSFWKKSDKNAEMRYFADATVEDNILYDHGGTFIQTFTCFQGKYAFYSPKNVSILVTLWNIKTREKTANKYGSC